MPEKRKAQVLLAHRELTRCVLDRYAGSAVSAIAWVGMDIPVPNAVSNASHLEETENMAHRTMLRESGIRPIS